jgi:hypothetical protein
MAIPARLFSVAGCRMGRHGAGEGRLPGSRPKGEHPRRWIVGLAKWCLAQALGAWHRPQWQLRHCACHVGQISWTWACSRVSLQSLSWRACMRVNSCSRCASSCASASACLYKNQIKDSSVSPAVPRGSPGASPVVGCQLRTRAGVLSYCRVLRTGATRTQPRARTTSLRDQTSRAGGHRLGKVFVLSSNTQKRVRDTERERESFIRKYP